MTFEGFNDDFRELMVLFAESGVEFVIVGAYALAFHGAPRASGDIDLFVRPTPQNAERVVRALEDFGAPLAAHGVIAGDFAAPGIVYQIGLPPRRIDVLTEISGLSFDEAWASRVDADIESQGSRLSVAFIGRDALIKNKTAAGRPKDVADVVRLRRASPGASRR
jgi:hypothetical protein